MPVVLQGNGWATVWNIFKVSWNTPIGACLLINRTMDGSWIYISEVSRCTKVRMFSTQVLSTYYWTIAGHNQLKTLQYWLARLLLGSKPNDHMSMSIAYHELGMLPLWVQLAEHVHTLSWSWAARLINLPGDCLPRVVMFSKIAEGKQNWGRPNFQWSDTLKAVLKWADLLVYQDWPKKCRLKV